MTHDGQPNGMYPMDSSSVNDVSTLEELISTCEGISDNLNLPISWYLYDEEHEEWVTDSAHPDAEPKSFEIFFLLPRKYGTVISFKLEGDFDSHKLMNWLNQWLPGEISNWFGWDLKLEYEGRIS